MPPAASSDPAELRPTDPTDPTGSGDAPVRTDLNRINQAMVRVWRGTKQRMAGRTSRFEGAGFILLGCLELAEPARLSDLATMLRLDASTVSRQVRALEESGLIHREPDPADRRATRLLLSEPGRAELTLLHRERNSVLAAATSSWTEAERDTLTTLLERLAADLEAPATGRAGPPTPPAGRAVRSTPGGATGAGQPTIARRSTPGPDADASLIHAVREVSHP